MSQSQLNWITNFIWGIADDVLRDLYVRGKYRDVILPMVVLRRLDAVLVPTQEAVLKQKALLDRAGIDHQEEPLRAAAGQAFYNTSPFMLKDLRGRTSQQQLRADFEVYLDGFSRNVQDILDNFEFRNQIPRLSKADVLATLIEKFLDPAINLGPLPVKDAGGEVLQPGLDNHAMGTIFEELVRRFNEDNNEEAGEHWTPRDAVKLMARLIFLPIADRLESGTYLLYDGACGTGGMLTVAEETLLELAAERGKQVQPHLYGQEINAETYAIAKADFLLKGEGSAADNLVGGSEHSTLANDAFGHMKFDFMLSNPPYGKSWKSDLERMGGKDGLRDARFVQSHAGEEDFSLLPRSSDGQLLFLVNLLSKMKTSTALGSRIAEVHNGSSLFTGDAGQGESNIRRWVIENDWLEAIVALPLNLFYNTGIATYVWVLTNRKPEHRRGQVQLIDATRFSEPLRKNLGKKNCQLGDGDIARICDLFLSFAESEESKIFPNAAFGYHKIVVERPLRLRVDLSDAARDQLWRVCEPLEEEGLVDLVEKVATELGPGPHLDPTVFFRRVEELSAEVGLKLTARRRKLLQESLTARDELATPVMKKVLKSGQGKADPLRGVFAAKVDGKACVVEYESDPELRDTEQVPLLEEGGIEGFLRREVLPHAPDAWYDPEATKIGYEISFNRYFYKPQPLRSLEEIRAKILALEQKQAIIHDAVTRGLAPNVRLKPSGIEWLGDIPEHWRVAPLKTAVVIQSGLTLGKEYPAGIHLEQLPYLRVANVQAGHLNLSEVKTLAVTKWEAKRCLLRRNDVLMTEGGDPDKLGRGCLWLGQIEPCLHQNHIFAVRTDQSQLRPKFLEIYLSTKNVRDYFIRNAKQTTNLASTNKTIIGNLPIILPPIAEQDFLLSLIEKQAAQQEKALKAAQAEIDLLREYRTRLIADVVTGKLDVRAAAAALPAELEADEELPELDEVEAEDGDDAELADAEE